jgi:hypothetical protein
VADYLRLVSLRQEIHERLDGVPQEEHPTAVLVPRWGVMSGLARDRTIRTRDRLARR